MTLDPLDIAVLMLLSFAIATGAIAVLSHMSAGDQPVVDPLEYVDLTDLVDGDRILALRSGQQTNDIQRSAIETTDTLMWHVGPQGHVTWHNRAYDDLLISFGHDPSRAVALPDLFHGLIGDGEIGTTCRRVALPLPDQTICWFDMRGRRVASGRILTASPVTEVIEDEAALRGFVQTLASTFAHLRVGLALFDRNRQLTLFNPALGDLTGLNPAWLTTRPRLDEFFDRLREDRIMPEPRNYPEWRAQLAELERAARESGYQDLWTLPDGRTFRILGQPHPQDGLAVVIEDISDEISTNRQLLAELSAERCLVNDAMTGMAVLDCTGLILRANQAFEQIVAELPDGALDPIMMQTTTEMSQTHLLDEQGRDILVRCRRATPDQFLIYVATAATAEPTALQEAS